MVRQATWAGKCGLGRELGALVVGEVEGRGAVGQGQEAQGRGLAGAGEGHHAQRAAGIGTPGCDDGGLLRAGLQGALQRHLGRWPQDRTVGTSRQGQGPGLAARGGGAVARGGDKDARRNAMTPGTVAIQDVLRLIIPPDLQSLPGARGKAWGAQVWAEQSLTRSSSRRQLHPRPRPRPFVPARGGSRTRPGESSSLADCGQLGCLLR